MMQLPPETSPFLHPTFLIGAGIAIVGLIAWFIRLEAKTNATAVKLDEVVDKQSELEDELYKHMMDNTKHYNEPFMNEFRGSLNQRFSNLENTLKQISDKIDRVSK